VFVCVAEFVHCVVSGWHPLSRSVLVLAVCNTALSTGHQATELLSGCLRTPVDNHACCPTMIDAGGLVSAVRDIK